MATGNSSYTAAITRTLQNHSKEIFDAVSNNNALFYLMNKAGGIKMSSGGRSFTHPVYHTANTSYKMYSPLEVIDTPIMDDYTRAEYEIKVGAGSFVLSLVELAKNAGDKEKLLDYGDMVRKAGEISMEELMGAQVFADGSNAKDFGGIPYLVNSSPSTQGTVGGISSTDNAYWRNIVGTAITAFNTANAGIASMEAALLDATKGTRGPTVVVTTKANYRLYMLSMTDQIRYTSKELVLGDKSFTHLAFGTIPVIPDDNCTTNKIYMLDLSSLWLQILSKGNFKITPFQPSHDQLSETALMYVLGNTTCGSRRTQAYISCTG